MPPRVIVIGIDGASFDLLDPWMDQGLLPNLRRVFTEGAKGPLEATIPINSAPSWTSFATGVKPDKHGIFGFFRLGHSREGRVFHNASYRKAPPFWSLASAKGLTAGVANVPLTYPPDDIEGYMISGMDAPPSAGPKCMRPQSLFQELEQAVGPYVVEPDIATRVVLRTDKEREEFIDTIAAIEKKRFAHFDYLARTRDVDVLVAVTTATDRLMHRFMWYLDPKSPGRGAPGFDRIRDKCIDVFRLADDFVGRMLPLTDDGATLLVVSDHGFRSIADKGISMEGWLHGQGMLAFAGGRAGRTHGLLRGLKHRLRRMLPEHLFMSLRFRFEGVIRHMNSYERYGNIDWAGTRAYSDDELDALSSVWINLKGREPEGIVEPGEAYHALREELRAKLLAQTDPLTGVPMTEAVHRREELFTAEYAHLAPDLIVQWKDGYSPHPRRTPPGSTDFCFPMDRKKLLPLASGEHSRYGIFGAIGNNVRPGTIVAGARIIDLAPTILGLLGLAAPDSMDGRMLTEVFRPATLAADGPAPTGVAPGPGGEQAFSDEEAEEIAERLKNLGYM
uniref:AP superfamily protein n=1 Tax=Desulfovibrio sp. U5L TaxID=596152 RepID=I2Q5B8_9BACT